MGGQGSVPNASLNVGGTLSFGVGIAVKITSIWKGMQSWVAEHHTRITQSANTTTAGARSHGSGGPGWTNNGSHLVSGNGHYVETLLDYTHHRGSGLDMRYTLPPKKMIIGGKAASNPKC
jgi:hypothetical protein